MKKVTEKIEGGKVEKTSDRYDKYMNYIVTQKVINAVEKRKIRAD